MSDALLYFKRAPSLPVLQTVGASPYIYTNVTVSPQVINVNGGAVSLIEINAGTGYLPQVGILGSFLVLPTQSIRITYLVTPPTVSVVTL